MPTDPSRRRTSKPVPKHDVDCLRRREQDNTFGLCTCGLSDSDVAMARRMGREMRRKRREVGDE